MFSKAECSIKLWRRRKLRTLCVHCSIHSLPPGAQLQIWCTFWQRPLHAYSRKREPPLFLSWKCTQASIYATRRNAYKCTSVYSAVHCVAYWIDSLHLSLSASLLIAPDSIHSVYNAANAEETTESHYECGAIWNGSSGDNRRKVMAGRCNLLSRVRWIL